MKVDRYEIICKIEELERRVEKLERKLGLKTGQKRIKEIK